MRQVKARVLGAAALAWGTTLGLVSGLAGASPAVAAEQVAAPVPLLDWQSCGPELAAFLCATAEVPTDYDEPNGQTTTIALTKLPASDPGQRIGTLFTNPGGPGGSGVDFVQQLAPYVYTPEVLARFDVLGFDPRGVGASDPATCYRTPEQEARVAAQLLSFPVTDAEERQFIGETARFATSCALTSRNRFAHASTANVARDMDLLRQAVGDEKLTYVGYSYGTFLGATYARLFPERVRALVLDGTLEPDVYTGTNGDRRSVGARTGQGPATAEVFGEFLRLCGEAGPQRCALAGLGDPRTVVEQTFEGLKTSPVEIPVPDGPPIVVDYQFAVVMAWQSMYSPAIWGDLATTLAYLATANAQPPAPVASLVARVAAEQAAPTMAAHRGEEYPSIGGGLASLCVDVLNPLKVNEYDDLADAEAAAAPHFGRLRAWVGLHCEFLRATDDDAYLGPWEQDVDQPVLVIGTRFDPATPYWMTEPYAEDFPDARVLTHEGWGHTILGQSQCADEAVARYLVDLEAEDGATCPTDIVPFAPIAPATRAKVLEQLSLVQ